MVLGWDSTQLPILPPAVLREGLICMSSAAERDDVTRMELKSEILFFVVFLCHLTRHKKPEWWCYVVACLCTSSVLVWPWFPVCPVQH